MRSILLAIIMCNAALVKTDSCGGFGYELIINALEALQNDVRSLEHNLKSIGTKVDQLTKTATDENIDQLKDVIIDKSKCPENGFKGVFQLKPADSPEFDVYCENGWIVIQRRFDGSLDFNRTWVPYREGFGNLEGEHWLGLEKVHQITRVGSYELMLVLKTYFGERKTAKYEGFKIGTEGESYQVKFVRFSGGNAGDGLLNATKFETLDRNNADYWGQLITGGWWSHSTRNNLNGDYINDFSWILPHDNFYQYLTEAQMMIRAMIPKEFDDDDVLGP